MASTPNFLLTPQQQELLFAALNANRPPTTTAPNALTMSPSSLTTSPAVSKPADLSTIGFNDSSFLDYDYSFDGADSGLDFTIGNGDSSLLENAEDDATANDDLKTDSGGSADNDSPEKRSHPDDEEEEPSGAKRRESTEKIPKKPGRKPLTSEPSSKRKAQNRAAQRAFRERKEKHLKDLETKVAELEKASETANSENGKLRAQVEKMSVELSEYKKRLALVNTNRAAVPMNGRKPFGDPIFNNINDVSFQFEFPKFGQLPGPVTTTPNSTLSASPSLHRSSSLDNAVTPLSDLTASTPATAASNKNSPAGTVLEPIQKTTTKDDLSKLSNVFTPPLATNNVLNARTSMDSTATSSPSASSITNTAPSSSCGTSPEPCNNQSPTGFKPVDTMATIGEEPSTTLMNTNGNTDQGVSQFAHVDINDINWMDAQSNFRFDPQLFGDYREPQENILSNGGFDDSFFNDALDIDFTTPFNVAPSPILHKNNLIAQIDAAKDAGEIESTTIDTRSMPPIPTSHRGTLLTCNKIWERLQTCPKVQNGDFDLDGLCSDLQKKAKCSGSGAVVDEHDFKLVMTKYLGKDGQSDCVNELASAVKAEQ